MVLPLQLKKRREAAVHCRRSVVLEQAHLVVSMFATDHMYVCAPLFPLCAPYTPVYPFSLLPLFLVSLLFA